MTLPIEYEEHYRFVKRLPECSNQVWQEFTSKYLPYNFTAKLSFDGAYEDGYIEVNKYAVTLSEWIRANCKGLWSCSSLHEGYWNSGLVQFYFEDGKSAMLFKLKHHGG